MLFTKRILPKPTKIILDGKPLPWVNELNHLGNTLETNNSMNIDCHNKKCKFIGKTHSLMQEFYFSDPDIKMHMIKVYASSFYGSSLWDLFGEKCERLYKTWNITIRTIFDVSPYTHRYLIETLSQSIHPKVFWSSRLLQIHNTITLTS